MPGSEFDSDLAAAIALIGGGIVRLGPLFPLNSLIAAAARGARAQNEKAAR